MSKATTSRKNKNPRNNFDTLLQKNMDDAPTSNKKRKNCEYNLDLEEDVIPKTDSTNEDNLDDNQEEFADVNSMLTGLGTGINKAVSAKTKLADNFSSTMLNMTVEYMDKINAQNKKREGLYKDFSAGLREIMKKKEAELQMAKENEEKLIRSLNQHMKYSQQKLAMLNKLDKDFADLNNTFFKTADQLNEALTSELDQIKKEVHNDLLTAKKKFSKDNASLQVSSMKKSLMQLFK